MKCYIVKNLDQVKKIALWLAKQANLSNPSLTLCWLNYHKIDVNYLESMLQKQKTNIVVAEDEDTGNIKAVAYFEVRDEQDKVSEKLATFASAVIDLDDWKKGDITAFNELLKFAYKYGYSQGIVKSDFWTLDIFYQAHRAVFGDEFLTVLDIRDLPPWGRTVRFLVDIKGAVEASVF
jgi:hypothetical protein